MNIQDRSVRSSEPQGGRSGNQGGGGLRAEGVRSSGEGVRDDRREVTMEQSVERHLQGTETPRANSHRSGGSNAELLQFMSMVLEMKDEIKALREQGATRDQPPRESNVGAAMGSTDVPRPVPPMSPSHVFMPLQSKAP